VAAARSDRNPVAPEVKVERVFNFTGGFPDCAACGTKEWACSNGVGNWKDGRLDFSLTESIPSSFRPTKIFVTLKGNYQCGGGDIWSNVNVTLNDLLVDYKSVESYSSSSSPRCQCNHCDGDRVFQNDLFSQGFPRFNVRGVNTLQIKASPDQPICLASVSLKIIFEAPEYRNVYITAFPNPKNGTQNYPEICKAETNFSPCSTTGYYQTSHGESTKQYADVMFKDPVSPSNIVIGVNMRLYANFPKYSSYSRPHFTAFANTQQVDWMTIGEADERPYYLCQFCSGGSYFRTSRPVMSGYPGYNYGGWNTMGFSLTNYQYAVGTFYIGRVEVELVVVPRIIL